MGNNQNLESFLQEIQLTLLSVNIITGTHQHMYTHHLFSAVFLTEVLGRQSLKTAQMC